MKDFFMKSEIGPTKTASCACVPNRGASLPELPDVAEADREHLERELRMVQLRDRDDAVQEAWIAHMEGRDPAKAVHAFRERQRRHRAREMTGVFSSEGEEDGGAED